MGYYVQKLLKDANCSAVSYTSFLQKKTVQKCKIYLNYNFD